MIKQKIGIIGGGPAGCSLAYFLRKKYPGAQITIYEYSQRIGGQSESYTQDNIVHELGTCFLTGGYTCIKEMLKTVSLTFSRLDPGKYYTSKSDETSYVSTTDLQSLPTIVKYTAFYTMWKLFGQENNPTWKCNLMTFYDFLKKYKMPFNTNILKISTTGQIYGPPEKITAYNAFRWFTPLLFANVFLWKVYSVDKGYQTLWEEIVKYTNSKVEFNSCVTSVKGHLDRAIITCNEKEIICDKAFVTTPLDLIENPAKAVMSEYGDIKRQNIVSLLVEFEKTNDENNLFVFDNLPHIMDIAKFPLANIKEKSKISWVLATLDDIEFEKSESEILEMLKKELYSFRDFGKISLKKFRKYKYNLQFSPEQLINKVPQKIAAIQGKDNIYYSGGLLSHWNVESISRFNKNLVREIK